MMGFHFHKKTRLWWEKRARLVYFMKHLFGRNAASWLVNPMQGDGDESVDLCPGELCQVSAIQHQEGTWSLRTWLYHNAQQHTCKTQTREATACVLYSKWS